MEKIHELLNDVSASDNNIQMTAINELFKISEEISNAVISALGKSVDGIFIAEKISNQVSNIYIRLSELFSSSEDNVKFNIALIFLVNNNFKYNSFLLQFASETANIGDAVFCLSKLASKGIVEAKPVIMRWISKINSGGYQLNDVKTKDLLESLKDSYDSLVS